MTFEKPINFIASFFHGFSILIHNSWQFYGPEQRPQN